MPPARLLTIGHNAIAHKGDSRVCHSGGQYCVGLGDVLDPDPPIELDDLLLAVDLEFLDSTQHKVAIRQHGLHGNRQLPKHLTAALRAAVAVKIVVCCDANLMR